MSLYQKHRPQTLEDMKGNTEIISTLNKMLSDLITCPHSFLITGQTGCGKTTIARIIASMLGTEAHDFREIDSADFRGIDSIREMRKQSQYLPLKGDRRVWLLDECHKLSNDAQNALLKILEDPPKHVYFILCTTDPQKLISTIKGRCSTFQVNPLNDTQMFGLLRKVAKLEGQTLPREIIEQIAESSQGHSRNALNTLEQVLNADEDERMNIAKKTAEDQAALFELCGALLKKDSWKKVAKILTDNEKQDAEGIRRLVLSYCKTVLLGGENKQAAIIMEEFREPFYNTGFPGVVLACYSIIKGDYGK